MWGQVQRCLEELPVVPMGGQGAWRGELRGRGGSVAESGLLSNEEKVALGRSKPS